MSRVDTDAPRHSQLSIEGRCPGRGDERGINDWMSVAVSEWGNPTLQGLNFTSGGGEMSSTGVLIEFRGSLKTALLSSFTFLSHMLKIPRQTMCVCSYRCS